MQQTYHPFFPCNHLFVCIAEYTLLSPPGNKKRGPALAEPAPLPLLSVATQRLAITFSMNVHDCSIRQPSAVCVSVSRCLCGPWARVSFALSAGITAAPLQSVHPHQQPAPGTRIHVSCEHPTDFDVPIYNLWKFKQKSPPDPSSGDCQVYATEPHSVFSEGSADGGVTVYPSWVRMDN